MRNGKFTAKEQLYLKSLPVVKSVTATRIRYTEQFRVETMLRYDDGESPVAIFRDAGLDPQLIGYKRIERCIARWRHEGKSAAAVGGSGDGAGNADLREQATALTSRRGGADQSSVPMTDSSGAKEDVTTAGTSTAGAPSFGGGPAANAFDGPDVAEAGLAARANAALAADERDMLIARQALRIDELERLIKKLVGC